MKQLPILIIILILSLFAQQSDAMNQVNVNGNNSTLVEFEIDANNIIKKGIKNPCGAVLCWLTDSDVERPRNRSMETALSEMRAGALRFPYGALSNNYIWTKDPQNTEKGLQPCIAVPSRPPGNWDWAVDENGFFKKDMDFEEYVTLCRKVGAEPVVCVNIMSHVYNKTDDITIDTLIYYAKEWVRYANITKGYDIKYWQLGNEQDHHSDIYPLNEFQVDYKRMAIAMHEVDSNIKIAPGLLSNWVSQMLNYCPEYIDFISCHQYLWFGGSETEAYEVWKDYGQDIIPNIRKIQNQINNSSKPNLEMFITETGVTGGKYPDPDVFNHYKALILLEMQLEQIATKNVKNTFYWGTHTPWNGEFGDGPISTLFSNNDENKNHLQADILKAINSKIQTNLLERKTQNGIVTYPTISAGDSLLTVFVLNKSNNYQNLKLTLKNSESVKKFEKLTLKGIDQFDANVQFDLDTSVSVFDNGILTLLPPFSASILQITLKKSGGTSSIFQSTNKNINVFPNPVNEKLILNSAVNLTKHANLIITNMIGQVVKSQVVIEATSINVSDLLKGFYVLKIKDSNQFYTCTFIKG